VVKLPILIAVEFGNEVNFVDLVEPFVELRFFQVLEERVDGNGACFAR